jgi:hypothetical protein
MLKLSISCTRFESNYSSCTGKVRAVETHVHSTAVQALSKKERQDET